MVISMAMLVYQAGCIPQKMHPLFGARCRTHGAVGSSSGKNLGICWVNFFLHVNVGVRNNRRFSPFRPFTGGYNFSICNYS